MYSNYFSQAARYGLCFDVQSPETELNACYEGVLLFSPYWFMCPTYVPLACDVYLKTWALALVSYIVKLLFS